MSVQMMRGAFSKLIMPLMLLDADLKFIHQIIHDRTFSECQKAAKQTIIQTGLQ